MKNTFQKLFLGKLIAVVCAVVFPCTSLNAQTEVLYGNNTSDSYAVTWGASEENTNDLTGTAWENKGGVKFSSTSNYGDKLPDGGKTYVKFTLSAGDEITIEWYHTSTFSDKVFHISWNNAGTNELVEDISISNPTSKVRMATTWTAPYNGTYYLSTSNTLYVHGIVLPGAACADSKPTISGTFSSCAASTTLSVSGQTAGATLQWYKDNVAIGGATGTSYSATADGNYKVVANKNCDVSSDAVAVALNLPTPSDPVITQNGNTVTISGTGGDIQYSLDGGTSWTTGTSFSITQDETVKAKITNSCGTSNVVTYNATYTDAPTCGVVTSSTTLDASTPYNFGDFKMYITGDAPTYTTSNAQTCPDLAPGVSYRYMVNQIVLYLENISAGQIEIIGHGKGTACEITNVEISDALNETYTTLSHGAITGDITNCGSLTIPNISANQGKYVRITFGSNAVRLSGICITPRPCSPTINATTTTIYNCGTNNNTTLTVTELTPGDGSNVGTWSSEDPSIATVNASGVVTGKAVGQVNIIFTPTDAEFCPAKKSITVNQVTLDGPDEVGVGKNITLTANVAGGTWSSNRTGVATVTGGIVTGVSGGTATITYSVNGCTATHDVEVLPGLSVIAPPVLSVPTIEGFTADWTASGESGVNGYILYIYNATTGAEVKVLNIPGQATDQAIITGLDPNTQYYAKIQVQGNGSTKTDSDLSPVSNTITTLKARVASACISEDFSILTDVGACPTGPGTSVRSSSGCASYELNLAGGLWYCESIRLITSTSEGRYDGNTIYFNPYNSGTPSMTLPSVDMPMEVSFYVIGESEDAKTLTQGLQVFQDGAVITSGITVDDVVLPENGSTATTADKTAPQLRPGGIIQVSNSKYQLVKVTLNPSNGSTIKIQSVGGKKYRVDNVTVKCDPMELTITPDLDGLSYVKDLGPSDPQDITVSGNNLPVESGTATLSGVDEFEVSLDNGVTWTSGGSVNIPFTGGSFARTIKVRLPKDRNIGTYSDVFTLSATGYTKPSPSVNVEGEVTLFPIVLNCGQAVDVLRLMSPGLDTDHPSFMDLAAAKNWTTSGTVESNKNALGAYAFKLNKSGLQSPSINANNYDFLRLSFDAQPSSGSGENKLLVQVYGANGYIYNEELVLPEKQIYHQTIDLQSSVTMGNYSVIISSPKQTFYVTNIVLEGTAKRKFNFEAESLDDFQSYPDCPSDVKEITVYGTCLDDNKSLDFTSYKNFGNEKYEFSANGTDGWSSALSIPYTGEFPLRGMKVYVRQKQGLEAGSVNDVILVQNGGRGSAFISLSGQATAAGTWYPADGAVYNFSSVSGEAAEFAIPFSGGPFCADPTVTTSCSGVTVSNCKGGAYASTTSFPATVTEGMIYVKYTPGTLTNCNIAVTAAGETHNVKVNWTGGAAVTTGVELAASSVKVPSAGVATVQSTAKGADMNAQVTITSDKFDVSMGNPAYGDFSAITTTKLDNMTGTLYIRPKAGATGSGTITFSTDGGSDVVLNCTIE